MKRLSLIIGISVALAAGGASAQSINLTGVFTCIQMCRGSLPAYVTQNGSEFNLLTEAGVPSNRRSKRLPIRANGRRKTTPSWMLSRAKTLR